MAAGLIAGFANGQEAHPSSVLFQVHPSNSKAAAHAGVSSGVTSAHSQLAHKTTSWPGPGGGRWYDYTASYTGVGILPITYPTGQGNTALDLWNDTAALTGYTNAAGTAGEYDDVDFTSIGLGLNPVYGLWNETGEGFSGIGMSAADAYTIDSVEVAGWYNRSYASPAKEAVVDTLILTFVYGDGGSSNLPMDFFAGPDAASLLPSYGLSTADTLFFLDMLHDSTNNRAGGLSGVSPVAITATNAVYKFLLTSSDTNNSNCFSNSQYPRASHAADPHISFPVPAGMIASMSVSFKSGDATYPAFPARDTLRYVSLATGDVTGYKYGCFNMNIIYDGTTTTPAFPPYYAADWTSGYFEKEGTAGWGGYYLPNWAWSSSTGASGLQYPSIAYHVTCSTCNLIGTPALGVNNVKTINKINAYPNPATDELNITYTSVAPVTVTLTNMLGQVVATQNATNGKVVFNTTELPSGLYIYSLQANGQRTTGQVAIAH